MGKKTRKKGGGGQNNVSLSGSIPTIEESLSQKITQMKLVVCYVNTIEIIVTFAASTTD